MAPRDVDLLTVCEARQLELDDSWRETACDEAVDRVRAKYGAGALRRAGAQFAPYHQRPDPPREPGS